MRTLTTFPRSRSNLPRIAALGLAAATAVTLAGCGGNSGSVGKSGGTGGKTAGGQSTAPPASTAPQSIDPEQGPIQDAAKLPKSCSGLVTDADIQLALGQPLVGGDFYANFAPLTSIKQTGKVKCQYGVIQDTGGKIQSDQVEVQMATYADAASAKSRAASTVAGMAAQNEQFKQVSVSGHPATLVTEPTDTVLVMYDGNRTFLVTVQAALAKGDAAEKLAESLADALYRHTLPVSAATPSASGTASPGAGTPAASTPGSTPAASATT
jgi:hypothetical protein